MLCALLEKLKNLAQTGYTIDLFNPDIHGTFTSLFEYKVGAERRWFLEGISAPECV